MTRNDNDSNRRGLNVLGDQSQQALDRRLEALRRRRDSAQPPPTEQATLKDQIIAALKTVFDPEIPVSIYDMGLVYDIDIDQSNAVVIRMTLTAPACPVSESLPVQVENTVQSIPQVTSARVEIVWEPPWNPDRMSEAAKLQLGMM